MPCYFHSSIGGYRIPTTSKIKCGGECIRLDTLYALNPELYGCENPVDLILLRGRGEIIDWNDESQVARIDIQQVCDNHLKDLILEWRQFPAPYKKNPQDLYICSLVSVDHILPDKRKKYVKTQRRISKDDSIIFMKAFHRICHPGTLICSLHLRQLHNKEFDKFIFNDESCPCESENEPDITDKDNEIVPKIDIDSLKDDDGSVYQPSHDDYFDYDDHQWDNEDITMAKSLISHDVSDPSAIEGSLDHEDEKLSMLRRISSIFGLSRLSSERDWDELRPDTQRKKISAMIHLQDELYKMCAGSSWETMKNACMKKIGQIVDCGRVTQILESIDDRLEHTTDRRSRLSLISIIAGHFTDKEIIHATGVSRYFIREAKKFALCGLKEVQKITRLRYNHPSVKLFVSFVSRPEVIVWLPKPARTLKLSSGDSFSMASVARQHSYRYIYTMFKSFLEVQGTAECEITGGDVTDFVRAHYLGYSSCVKLMEKLIPTKTARMQCVDLFEAEAIDAFETTLSCVLELQEKGKISDCEANDLRRRLKVARNYLTGYYRMHLSTSSTCSSHCIRYALSDPNDVHSQSRCDHNHEESCEQCSDTLSTFSQIRSFLKDKLQKAVDSNDSDRYRIERMIYECEDSKGKVFEYQKHLVRAALSEMDRVNAIDGLDDGCAIITMDFSLKLMPTGFVESQSQWFGKAGISFHVSHTLFKKAGKQLHHTLGHLNDEAKQDGTAICIITDHIFNILAENGVTHLLLRSDNAGSYRNAGVISTLRLIATKYGIVLVAYLFSEPQAGKGAADRQISLAKCKIRSVVNSGGNARNAEEILKVLCTAPLLKAYSFYQIRGEQVKKSEKSIEGIGSLSSFRYENEGIRTKKYDSIGSGNLIQYDELDAIQFKYEILCKGGHLSKSNEFWGELSDHVPKIKDKQMKPVEDESDDDEEEKIFRCTEGNCSMTYFTLRGLEDHLLVGKHKEQKHSDTIVQAAAKLFADCVETNESAYLSMKVDSLSSFHSKSTSLQLKEGWANREKNRIIKLDPLVRREVRKYFVARRKEGKRAEARVVAKMIRNKTNSDGSYVYPFEKCLKESQAQGLITRFLKVEASKAGLKSLESDCDEETDAEDADNPEENISNAIENTIAKRRGRPKKIELSKKPENETRDSTNLGKKRGRPSKKSTSGGSEVKSKPGNIEKDKKEDISGSATSSRILRDRKRPIQKKEIDYNELSSDEELDEYTIMMNALLEQESSDEEF